MKPLNIAALLTLTLSLAACGGGGTPTPTPQPQPQPGPDTTPPSIVSITPASGATGIAKNADIVITFSEKMNQAATQAAYQSTDLPASGVTFNWNADGTVLTINPNADLAYTAAGKTYSFSLSTTATDVAGNALPATTSSFKTFKQITTTINSTAALDGWANHPRVVFESGMNEPLAHRIYAGAQAFAMPSRFEPCGLSQLIAMRYGTLPVVRETGGLVDTVPEDVGFRFAAATPDALATACRQALTALGDRAEWQARVERAMTLDFSWDGPARHYLDLYGAVLNAERPAAPR